MLAHIQEAEEQLHKPLVLEEFGKKIKHMAKQTVANVRDPVYEEMYGLVEASIDR